MFIINFLILSIAFLKKNLQSCYYVKTCRTMDSHKNALQEFLQASKRGLPRYETREVESQRYQSTIYFDDDQSYFSDVESLKWKSKRAAEQHIAHITLKKLVSDEELSNIVNTNTNMNSQIWDHLVLIDGESFLTRQNLISKYPKTRFIIFTSYMYNPLIQVSEKTNPNCEIRYAPVVGQDACYTYMSYETRKLQDEFPSIKCGIVSNQIRQGQILAKCANLKFISNDDELDAFLSSTPHFYQEF